MSDSTTHCTQCEAPAYVRVRAVPRCYKCQATPVIDLGDNDYICQQCWHNHTPSVV